MRPPATTTQASRQTLAECLYSLRPRSRRRPSRTTDRLSPASGPATTEAVSSPLLRHGVALAQGPRDEMEDFVSVIPRALCGYMFAGVFDGHSGSAAARFLVDRLYPALVSAIDESALSADECEVGDDDGDAGAAPATAAGVCCPVTLSFALAAAFDGVDRALLSALARLRSSDPEREAGSTATVLLARPGRLVAANVGDSRAVLCRGGAAIDLTTEHRVDGPSPAAASEIGRVNAAGGWIDDGRVCGVLAVSRAFGDRGLKRPGLTTTLKQGVVDGWWDRAFADAHRSFSADPVIPTPDVTEIATSAADEFVVIASDGLWDVLSSRDACALARRALRRGEGPGGAAEALAAAAAKRRTEDNVAVVVIDLKGGEGGEGSGKAGGFFSGLFG